MQGETNTARKSAANRRREHLSRRTFLAGTAGAIALAGLGVGTGLARDDGMQTTTFTVRIENVSEMDTLETSAMGETGRQPVPLSPGAWAVHTEPGPIFTPGEPDRGQGLERIAEDGDPTMLSESLSDEAGVKSSAAFATPVGADEPAPIGPGGAYEFDVEASPGDRLSFVTMFVPSNDLFYAPDDRGLALFDGDEPLSGDKTIAVGLWDAGSEVNEEPGVGPNQVQRQSGADTGPDENGAVRLITEVADGYSYPPTAEVIRVTLESGAGMN